MKKKALALLLCAQMAFCTAAPVAALDSTDTGFTAEQTVEENATDKESSMEEAAHEQEDSVLPEDTEETGTQETLPEDISVPDTESLPEKDKSTTGEDDAETDVSNELPAQEDVSLAEIPEDSSAEELFIPDDSSTSSNEETVGAALRYAIQDASVSVKNMTYTGKALKPVPVVTFTRNKKSVTLTEGKDYTIVSYSNNVKPGKAVIKIEGTGSYTGTVSKSFRITCPVSKTSISYKQKMANTGKGWEQAPAVKLGRTTLKQGTDYTVSCVKKKATDTYSTVEMKITGKGYYTGSVTRKYTFLENSPKAKNGQTYKIILSADWTKCIGIGSNTRENAGVYVRNNNSCAESRKFILKSCGNGLWKLVSQTNDYVVRCKYNASQQGQVVVTTPETGKNADRFRIQYNNDGTFTFISAQSGNALDVRGNGTAADTPIQMYKSNGTTAQKFYMVPVDAEQHTYSGIYKIMSSVNNGYIMEVGSGCKYNEANVDLGKNAGKNYQLFRLLYSGEGTYRIQNVHSYSVLEVANNKYANFTNVWQRRYDGRGSQRWKVKKNADGTLTFLCSVNTSFALDLYAANASHGTNIDIYTVNGTKAQKWKIQSVSERYPLKPADSELKKPVSDSSAKKREEIVNYAKSWVGKISYRLGASEPLRAGGSSDCSWFIYHVYNHFGLMDRWHKSLEYGRGTVPGSKIITGGMKNALPGDVLMWFEGGNAGHVIIYAGNGMAVGCNGITTTTGSVDYRNYTYPCGRDPDAIVRLI